jgi:vacuolar-type H+-ATPase subunit E/Vma4
MSDTNNYCNPDTLPDNLILSDKELSQMICIIIANVELKRKIIRRYRELLEKMGVNKNRSIENIDSPQAFMKSLIQQQLEQNLNKNFKSNTVENQEQIFTSEEIEDIRKTLDKIKTASNKPPEKENNNTNQ